MTEPRRAVDVGVAISDLVKQAPGALDTRTPEGRQEVAYQVAERLRITNRHDFYERRKIWPRCLLNAYGMQNLLWDTEGGRWLPKKVPSARRFESNLLIMRLAQFLAQYTQHRPNLTAIPLNTDVAAERQARVAEHLFAFDWRDLKVWRARQLATINCALFGMGIIETGWDPYAGDVIPDTDPVLAEDGSTLEAGPEGAVLGDGEGEPIKAERAPERYKYKGRIFVRSVSPFSFFTPPHVDSPALDDCPWVIRIAWLSEVELRELYSKDREGGFIDKDWNPGNPDSEFTQLEPIQHFLARFVSGMGKRREDSGLHLLVQYYQPACDLKGFNQGKVFSVVNHTLVGEHQSLFHNGRYPFSLLPWIAKPNRFWPFSWLQSMLDPQARYNQTLSHLMSLLALFSNPDVMIPKGSGLPQQLAFALKGYFYNPSAGSASFLTPPQPSAAIYQMQDRALMDLDRTSGQYGFSRGEHQQNVPSGVYAEAMAQRDLDEMGPMIREHGEAFAEVGSNLIELHHTRDDTPRLLAIVGESNRPELYEFQGTRLALPQRFVTQESSLVPSNAAFQLAKVERLMKMGLIVPDKAPVPPRAKKALLDFAQLPQLVDVETGQSELEAWIKRVLGRLIEEGKDVAPNPLWPDHAVVALKDGLDERVLKNDADHWDEKTVQRVVAFTQTLKGILDELSKRAEAEQDRQAQKQVEIQAQLQAIKTGGRVKEVVTKEAAKTGMGLLAGLAGPPLVPTNGAGAAGPGNGGGKPPEGNDAARA